MYRSFHAILIHMPIYACFSILKKYKQNTNYFARYTFILLQSLHKVQMWKKFAVESVYEVERGHRVSII